MRSSISLIFAFLLLASFSLANASLAVGGDVPLPQETQQENIAPAAAVSIAIVPTHIGQVIPVGENGVASVAVQNATAVVVNFEAAQPVKAISVTTSVAVEAISVQAQQLPQKPAPVPEPAAAVPGVAVSHYLEITVAPTAATSVQVQNATIEFKVPKAWLSTNNIDPATVRLMKYNEQWIELPTTATGTEDATYKYYTATTTGFSTFAVTGKSAAQAVPSNLIVIISAIIVVVVLVTIYAVFTRRSK